MLSGRFPFSGKNINHDIVHEAHSFPPLRWKHISKECLFFIDRLLEKDSSQRITAAEAFNDPWFKILTDDKLKIQTDAPILSDEQLKFNNEIVDNLVSFKG